MIPINQKRVAKGEGDCMSAAVASLLELPLSEVPYFKGMAQDKWFIAVFDFIFEKGYEFHGTGYPRTPHLKECPNIDGFLIASVPSRTHEGVTHSVIIDMDFRVVHDPNPNKLWQGEIIHSLVLNWWMISKKEDDNEH